MSAESLDKALQKLTKWRKFFATWQLGTRSTEDGELKAIVNQRELFILLRVELNSFAKLMLAKGVFTEDEWMEALENEARLLDQAYEDQYAGFSTSAEGLHMQMPQALATMRRLGFPP